MKNFVLFIFSIALFACADSESDVAQSSGEKSPSLEKSFLEKIFSVPPNQSPAEFLKQGAQQMVAPADIFEELNKAPDLAQSDAARQRLSQFLNLPPDNAEILQGTQKLESSAKNFEDLQSATSAHDARELLSVLRKMTSDLQLHAPEKQPNFFAQDQGDFEREK